MVGPSDEQQGHEQPEASDAMIPKPPPDAARQTALQPADDGLFGAELAPGGVPAVSPSAALSVSALFRSKWLILGVFLLVCAVTIPPIWLLIEPKYQATALVRVSPVASRLVFKTEDNTGGAFYRSFLNTQVSIVRSPTVLQRVLDDPKVRQTDWYRKPPRTLRTLLGGIASPPLERLLKAVQVRPRRNTELIDVSMSTVKAQDAGIIVNAVVDHYQRYSDETVGQRDIQRRGTLSAESKLVEQDIEGLVATQHSIANPLGTLEPEELRSQRATRLGVLEAQSEEKEREHKKTLMRLAKLRALEAGKADETQDAPSDDEDDASRYYARDPEWQELRRALKGVRHELDLAGQQYGEKHPKIERLLARVAFAEKQLRERGGELKARGDSAVGSVVPLSEEAITFRMREAAYEGLAEEQQYDLQLLGEAIENQRAGVDEAGRIALDLAKRNEELSNKRQYLRTIRSRLQALEMEDKAPARIGVAAHAFAPSEPHRDRRLLLTVMALGGALMAGVAVAYLRISMDPKIWEAEDVRHVGRVPFLGQLPPLRLETDARSDANPLLTECMRMVRTALLERLNGTERRVVLVTGASTRAGKTVVATELARSLTNLGKKTLLVEADLRRPALAERMGLEPAAGLCALLHGTADDSQVIVAGDMPNLDVVVAGERTGSIEVNSELLANGVFASCLARWKKAYDYVVLDSPPVLPVADARILASQVDGIIMVLRSSHCRRADVVQAYADLSTAGGRLLGTVLVGVRPGSGYGYGYEYYSESQPPRPAGPDSLKA